ncbi:DUF1206 domain-containing protein [Bifidobacterium rousetti]|uniref:DUF1206 domain-containing protein n=1 Tax=Bifidobacterium rousetti TaxID=2045439 RepID=UPI001CC2A46A|nr:DUF1206 domain-containing protein [Bifidobacterium rousetti]
MNIGRGTKASTTIATVEGIFLILAAVTTQLLWLWLTVVLTIMATAVTVYSAKSTIMAWKNGYTAEKMYQELEHMAGTEKYSSLIAISNGNKYLLYHDTGWDCDFFPNRATNELESENVRMLTDYLSNGFDIPRDDFTLTRVTGATREKYSTEHEETRVYHYTLYRADITRMPDAWKTDRFHVDSKDCRWMTTDEMLADPRIREVNRDVVTIVRDNA